VEIMAKDNTTNNASLFHEVFSPYRKQYLFQRSVPSLFAKGQLELQWATASRYLTDIKIDRAIAGTLTVGYYLSLCPSAFCVDIDDHQGKGEGFLLSVYNRVRRCFLSLPSVVVRSPRGLHLHYFLRHPVPELLLIERVRAQLRGIPAEVRPTHETGLRVPCERNLLDPYGLEPLTRSFREVVKDAERYHPVELFGVGIEPGIIRESLNERKERAVSLAAWKRIARVECLYGQSTGWVKAGETNLALCEIIPIYRSSGLSAHEAAMEFHALIAPGYHGELLTFRRLLQRVKSFYRHTPQTRFTQAPARREQEDLFTGHLAQVLAGLLQSPTETRQQKTALTRKRRTVKKAVVFLEGWLAYLRDVVVNKRFLEMWDYLYPYFKKNTKDGYYPISRNLFKGKMLEHYERWLLPFFCEIGYLERLPHTYSNIYGICYYYRINGDRFIGMDVPSTVAPVAPRVSKADERAAQIRAYKREHQDMSNRAIARVLEVDEKTIRNALKEML
jgi:hypothetical protein